MTFTLWFMLAVIIYLLAPIARRSMSVKERRQLEKIGKTANYLLILMLVFGVIFGIWALNKFSELNSRFSVN
jgi:hypothetical protein